MRVVHEVDEADTKPSIDVCKSPRELFSQYLGEHDLEDEDLLKLFDELMEEELETYKA